MNYRIHISLCVFLILGALEVKSQESSGIFSEISTGIGKDRNTAIQDALKNAVQQSFGVFVESSESLKDGKFSEEIFTNSKGYIESYDLASAGVDGDVYRVTVHARMSAAKLVSKLEKAKIPVKRGATEVLLNFNKKLNKRLFERDRDAREAELLLRALKGMPKIKDYIGAKIVSAKEIDLDRDNFFIQTRIRYEYDWNKILNYNRELDRLLQLSGVSKSSSRVNDKLEDLELVSLFDDYPRWGHYHETRHISLPPLKGDREKAFEHRKDGFVSIPLLTNLELTLPPQFPDSGLQEKRRLDRLEAQKSNLRFRFSKPPTEVRQPLGTNAVCEWTVHQISEEVWKQVDRKFPDYEFRKQGETIVATAYGRKPLYRSNYGDDLKHYFRAGHTAPIEFDNRGLSRRRQSFMIGSTQSIWIRIDDLKRTTEKTKEGVYIGGRPIPWRESVRLTWLDGSELKQPIAKWETTNGQSYSGQLIMVRAKGKVAVIRLKDSTKEIEIPIEELTKDSAKHLPVDVTLNEN